MYRAYSVLGVGSVEGGINMFIWHLGPVNILFSRGNRSLDPASKLDAWAFLVMLKVFHINLKPHGRVRKSPKRHLSNS